MKNILKKAARSLMLVPAMALALSFAAVPFGGSAYAADPTCDGTTGLNATTGAKCAKGTGTSDNLFGQGGIFRTITNVLLFLIGAVAVIMLIIGGIRYTISGGDSTAVTAAKNTILYSIVGIIVALLAYAIVNFVLDSFTV
ncbi:hypothetical protein RAAC3_TM7C00001G0334 [Candidatus Saccharibacteria bacterium RAAC3_TM7_1]|nr:hypothetical protein RAAC3_TM7C00001G0334 [Candidatus Saccharibacteria bacterium RAAC3_TM7_1]HCZ28288.1 hypothetical protein [Candidatus Saccharibacteria bacterium]